MSRPARPRTLLHTALRLDAFASAAMGALLATAGGVLADPLGLPEPLLRSAGAALLPYAVLVSAVGRRATVPRRAALAIVGGNALWVVASVLLLVLRARAPQPPTAGGYAVVVLQALAVLVFAELQWAGLRRPDGPATRPAAA